MSLRDQEIPRINADALWRHSYENHPNIDAIDNVVRLAPLVHVCCPQPSSEHLLPPQVLSIDPSFAGKNTLSTEKYGRLDRSVYFFVGWVMPHDKNGGIIFAFAANLTENRSHNASFFDTGGLYKNRIITNPSMKWGQRVAYIRNSQANYMTEIQFLLQAFYVRPHEFLSGQRPYPSDSFCFFEHTTAHGWTTEVRIQEDIETVLALQWDSQRRLRNRVQEELRFIQQDPNTGSQRERWLQALFDSCLDIGGGPSYVRRMTQWIQERCA